MTRAILDNKKGSPKKCSVKKFKRTDISLANTEHVLTNITIFTDLGTRRRLQSLDNDSILAPDDLPPRDKYRPLDSEEKAKLETMIRTYEPRSQIM